MKKCRCPRYFHLPRCKLHSKVPVPRLPLEIWLFILKIKRWTDRKYILSEYHRNPNRRSSFYKPTKLNFPEFTQATGWNQKYYINYITYHYCTLTYPNPHHKKLLHACIIDNECHERDYWIHDRPETPEGTYILDIDNTLVWVNLWKASHPYRVYFNKVG